jgi:hypothetical protein
MRDNATGGRSGRRKWWGSGTRAAGLATHPAHWGAFIAMGDWR